MALPFHHPKFQPPTPNPKTPWLCVWNTTPSSTDLEERTYQDLKAGKYKLIMNPTNNKQFKNLVDHAAGIAASTSRNAAARAAHLAFARFLHHDHKITGHLEEKWDRANVRLTQLTTDKDRIQASYSAKATKFAELQTAQQKEEELRAAVPAVLPLRRSASESGHTLSSEKKKKRAFINLETIPEDEKVSETAGGVVEESHHGQLTVTGDTGVPKQAGSSGAAAAVTTKVTGAPFLEILNGPSSLASMVLKNFSPEETMALLGCNFVPSKTWLPDAFMYHALVAFMMGSQALGMIGPLTQEVERQKEYAMTKYNELENKHKELQNESEKRARLHAAELRKQGHKFDQELSLAIVEAKIKAVEEYKAGPGAVAIEKGVSKFRAMACDMFEEGVKQTLFIARRDHGYTGPGPEVYPMKLSDADYMSAALVEEASDDDKNDSSKTVSQEPVITPSNTAPEVGNPKLSSLPLEANVEVDEAGLDEQGIDGQTRDALAPLNV